MNAIETFVYCRPHFFERKRKDCDFNKVKMKITTVQQFEVLVSEMEKNPAYAKGFRKGIKPLNFNSFWNVVAEKVNPFGPPVRDREGWHKVWKDLKFKVKKKLVNNKTEARATGGANRQIQLSPLEEAVANLLQFEQQINPKGSELGLVEETEIYELLNLDETTASSQVQANAENAEEYVTEEYVEDETPTVSTRVRSSRSTKPAEKERIELLRKQTEIQEVQCDHLQSIKGYMKDVSRYQRKRYEIEEERLKIYKRKVRKEEELLELDAAIKRKKLELLEKQLSSNI
ncbi:uncharacterized protein LOC118751505 [Rhagoletis pomonella]|uniref:uncharacterized protein LOC118751505 n=1 Tax=Rhagoletis pomonella TaxID=28610 RepID=UPI00177CACF5|nr:uncharacterized protein LOC118751505 [Rhagoletis pomonella]